MSVPAGAWTAAGGVIEVAGLMLAAPESDGKPERYDVHHRAPICSAAV
ncbi:hypothetical protein G5V59_12590 [Nocardioides sp. W3-2-3]|nr:hypothetical protein [Nocardioides convexus]